MAAVKKFERPRIEVEAIQYLDSGAAISKWIRKNHGTAAWYAYVPPWTSESGAEGYSEQLEHIFVATPAGDKRAHIGDWIVKGESGEFYVYGEVEFGKDFKEMNVHAVPVTIEKEKVS